MTACRLSFSMFLALLALVAAEALPPDAVPVMCAAICGPIVELSSMCSPKRSLGRLESSHLDREEHPRQARWPVKQMEQIEKRFVIIVPVPIDNLFPPEPSPTSIPPVSWSQLSSSSSSSSSPVLPSQTPTSIPQPNCVHPTIPPPAQVLSTTSDNRAPTTAEAVPPAPTPTTSSNIQPIISSAAIKTGTTALGLPTTSPTLSSHHTSILPTILGSGGNNGGETGGWGVTENAEEKCVCLNDSFNVAEIAGLCTSCISRSADTQNDMEVIMSVCGFPPQQYSPDKDSLASNIWVKATRPTAAYAGSAKLNGASRSTQIASIGPAIGVAGFVIGALTIL